MRPVHYLLAVTFAASSALAGWDYHFWTQEEVDQYAPDMQHLVGRVWWMKHNGDGNPDTSNWPAGTEAPFVISGTLGSRDRWPMGWNGRSIDIQWTDNLRGEWITIGDTEVGPGCAPVRFNVRVDGPLGQRIKTSPTGFIRTLSKHGDRPRISGVKYNANKITVYNYE